MKRIWGVQECRLHEGQWFRPRRWADPTLFPMLILLRRCGSIKTLRLRNRHNTYPCSLKVRVCQNKQRRRSRHQDRQEVLPLMEV